MSVVAEGNTPVLQLAALSAREHACKGTALLAVQGSCAGLVYDSSNAIIPTIQHTTYKCMVEG